MEIWFWRGEINAKILGDIGDFVFWKAGEKE